MSTLFTFSFLFLIVYGIMAEIGVINSERAISSMAQAVRWITVAGIISLLIDGNIVFSNLLELA